MKQVFSSVVSNSEVMPGTHLLWLESPLIASLAQPGQFVMVRCGEETLLRRPLSFHSVVMDRFALLFTVVGRGTQWLSQRQAGDNLDILGPLGNGFVIYPDSHHLLLVAGGIGIAPLCLLAQQAWQQGCSVRLLLGAATAAHLYPRHLLSPEAKLNMATEDGSAGAQGMITDLLPGCVDWADQVFACGPLPMYQTMAQMPELKNKPVQISLEVRMGCGRGLCYGCTIRTKQGLKKVCADGPLFELDDILWDELNNF